MTTKICWFEIYVQDMGRARAFYEAVFATKLTQLASDDFEMWGFDANCETSGASGALIKMEGAPSGFAGSLVYFSCEDCAHELARVTLHGGRIFKEKHSIGPYGFIALVYDSENNMIGLHSMV